MLPVRTTQRDNRDRVMIGAQFKREVHKAMAAADVPSISELCRLAPLDRNTLYAWFRGERTPMPDTLKRVADVLHVRSGDLWSYQEAAAGRLNDAELGEIRSAVAEGIALGVARALAQLGVRSPAPPRQPRPRQ